MMDTASRLETKAFNVESNHLHKLRQKLNHMTKAILLEKGWLFYIVGFLLGRAVILSVVSPFAVAFLATMWLIHRNKSRSEEHTSELQSRFDLVCRLLLEKKKWRIKVWYLW